MSSRVATSATGVVFDLERFEWTERDRIEVAGSWSGVRGHRFMRPVLEVPGRRPMHALLEHKPWSHDQDEWVAAFAWSGPAVEVAGATLTVSPGIEVTLPPP